SNASRSPSGYPFPCDQSRRRQNSTSALRDSDRLSPTSPALTARKRCGMNVRRTRACLQRLTFERGMTHYDTRSITAPAVVTVCGLRSDQPFLSITAAIDADFFQDFGGNFFD